MDDVEVLGEIRCYRCNRREFNSPRHLERHTRQEHTPPVITGTLAYKRAQQALQEQAQLLLPKITIGGIEVNNVWVHKWLGTFIPGDGDQVILVQRQCDLMWRCFYEMEYILTDRNTQIGWRLQYYVTGVLATALHNIGC